MVDQDTFRDALGAVCTPVAIVTSALGGRPHGTTVSAFCSLSLEPQLVLAALDRKSDLLGMIRESQIYGINVLERDQERLATKFARKGDDKFDGVDWGLDHGLPRIEGVGSWLACSLHRLIEGGDHMIVVGEVEHAAHDTREPLLYRQRTFGTLAAAP